MRQQRQFIERLVLPEKNPLGQLAARMLWTLALFALACVLLFLERDGLRDTRGGAVDFLGVVYFAVVTVTTIGYGDIVPDSNAARAMITFGITPLRIAIWLIVLSTAYEFTLKRTVQSIQFSRIRRFMKGHSIICGFGVKGRAAADEMLRRGTPPEAILVIDTDPAALKHASQRGITGILGDAASEDTLREAAAPQATNIIVVPHGDETCVLVCLTARDLAPNARIVASAREDENVRLIERSGADTVIAPSTSGGRLLAAATESPISARLLSELSIHGIGADIFDYTVPVEEAGQRPSQVPKLAGCLILGVRSGTKTLPFGRSGGRPLEAGDIVVVLRPATEARPAP